MKLVEISPARLEGSVKEVSSFAVDIAGLTHHLAIGDRLELHCRAGKTTLAEIVGLTRGFARAMTFGPPDGLGVGAQVSANWPVPRSVMAVTGEWMGRVVDPLGQPLDGRGPMPQGSRFRTVRGLPPNATLRSRLGSPIDLGVRAINLFATCREGQRIGLFAGSGVGKSTLLSMLARHTKCDVAVLALVGERGREVREFLEDELGSEGLARAVTIVATSDSSPLMRREAAYCAMTVAEHFRDEGKSVLLLMDSVTRFCFALREIGLAAGEPPATRGYPPSAFAELPRLLERAGPGLGGTGKSGFITAVFTVLVEGDDHNEPVADAVRGILDGHVILDRRIAERGRYPAIDVLRSLSRVAEGCITANQKALVARARAILALHGDVADLVRLGAYRSGTDPTVDEALLRAPRIEQIIHQSRNEHSTVEESFLQLAAALGCDMVL